jgi:hypothetical protein
MPIPTHQPRLDTHRTRAPSLHRSYSASSLLWAPPTSASAGTRSAVAPHRAPLQISRVSSLSLRTCCANYPGRFLRQLRLSVPENIGLHRYLGGSTSASILSGPAQASLALRPARSPTQLKLGPCPWSFTAQVAPNGVQVATKMNRQFLGPDFLRLLTDSFHVTPDKVVIC